MVIAILQQSGEGTLIKGKRTFLVKDSGGAGPKTQQRKVREKGVIVPEKKNLEKELDVGTA